MSIVLLLTCRHLRVQNANGILTVPTALWQCQRHFANADGFDLHYTNRGLTSHKGSADRLTQPRQGSKEAKRYSKIKIMNAVLKLPNRSFYNNQMHKLSYARTGFYCFKNV